MHWRARHRQRRAARSAAVRCTRSTSCRRCSTCSGDAAARGRRASSSAAHRRHELRLHLRRRRRGQSSTQNLSEMFGCRAIYHHEGWKGGDPRRFPGPTPELRRRPLGLLPRRGGRRRGGARRRPSTRRASPTSWSRCGGAEAEKHPGAAARQSRALGLVIERPSLVPPRSRSGLPAGRRRQVPGDRAANVRNPLAPHRRRGRDGGGDGGVPLAMELSSGGFALYVNTDGRANNFVGSARAGSSAEGRARAGRTRSSSASDRHGKAPRHRPTAGRRTGRRRGRDRPVHAVALDHRGGLTCGWRSEPAVSPTTSRRRSCSPGRCAAWWSRCRVPGVPGPGGGRHGGDRVAVSAPAAGRIALSIGGRRRYRRAMIARRTRRTPSTLRTCAAVAAGALLTDLPPPAAMPRRRHPSIPRPPPDRRRAVAPRTLVHRRDRTRRPAARHELRAEVPPIVPAAAGFGEDDVAYLAEQASTRSVWARSSARSCPSGRIDQAYVDSRWPRRRACSRATGSTCSSTSTRTATVPTPTATASRVGDAHRRPAQSPDPFPTYYVTNHAMRRAFRQLLGQRARSGRVPLREHYAAAVRAVVAAVADEPPVLGYDLMNEPWPGSVYEACLTGCPDIEQARPVRSATA